MKKLLMVLGISSLLAMGACETPAPSSDPNNQDSTTTNTTHPDSTMNKPDTTKNQ